MAEGTCCWRSPPGDPLGRIQGPEILTPGEAVSLLRQSSVGRVALEVDSPVMLYKSGWSVLAHGVADEIRGADELARARALPLEPWAGGAREHWLRIRIVQVTGRRLPERGRYPRPPA